MDSKNWYFNPRTWGS